MNQMPASCSTIDQAMESGEREYPGNEESFRHGPVDRGATTPWRPLTILQGHVERKPIERLMVKSAGRLHLLKADGIDWIEAAGNYVEVHVGPKTHLLRTTMNCLEARLDPRQFLRIHRSVIVNIERIKELEPWSSGDYRLLLHDGTQLTLSRTHRDRLERFFGNPL